MDFFMKLERHFDALTSLRGLFSLIIVLFHTMPVDSGSFSSIPGVSFISQFGGRLGVSIFFILSGFFMSYSYRDRLMAHSISFGPFLAKKLRKLYPLYLITNLAALFLNVIQYGMSGFNLERIALTFLMKLGDGLVGEVPYNGPTWFVCTLFFCYVIFFCLTYYSKSMTQYCCSIVLGIICGHGMINAGLNIPFCTVDNGVGLMNFFVGCALAEIYPKIGEQTHKWLRPATFVTLLFFLYLLHGYGVIIICGDVYTAFALLISPFIIYLALANGLCSKILQWKPFVCLGRFSSSIFFWHWVVYLAFRYFFSRLFPNQNIQGTHFLIYFVIMMIWSVLFQIIFQKIQSRRHAVSA